MHITQQVLHPSRDDAVRLTRSEKLSMIVMCYAATVLDDLQKEIPDRLRMIENGPERMKELADKSDALLNDLRLTIPMNQRMNLQNTAKDFEMRLSPKLMPGSTNALMSKDEFKDLVDIARSQCRDCIEDDTTCTKCRLYKLLTAILPLEDYSGMLCPYNMGEWGN